MNLGKLIKELRKEKRLTQEQLGDKLGVKKSYLSSVENGSLPATEKLMSKIGKLFSIPLCFLYFMATEESDIAEDKKETYKLIKNPISSMMRELF